MIPNILSRLVTATLLALTAATRIHAETVTVIDLEVIDRRVVGSDALCCLSGADTARDGSIVLVSDLGVLFGAELDGAAGTLTIMASTPLRLSDGSAPGSALSNAEGLAIMRDGTHAISFEGRHRVAKYTARGFGVSAEAIPEDVATRTNTGAEALAADSGDTLWVISELEGRGGYDVATLLDGAWTHRGKLKGHPDFNPVGADFAPGGDLYVLERSFKYLGFASRLRRISDPDTSLEAETVWQSPRTRHDNLEAVAVISQTANETTLLLVSDDNDFVLQRTEALLLTIKP
jgi:hypothetical protein